MKKINVFYKETMGWYNSENYDLRKENSEIKEFQNSLFSFQREIIENLWDNQNILRKVNDMLKWQIENPLDVIKLLNFQDKLYKSPDRLQHTLGLVVEINQRQYENSQELIDDLSIVLNEKELPRSTKILLVKNLKSNDFNLNWTESITVFNHILTNYPQYKNLIDDYMQETIDPNDWKLTSTNLF